jgi:hypothetical protein
MGQHVRGQRNTARHGAALPHLPRRRLQRLHLGDQRPEIRLRQEIAALQIAVFRKERSLGVRDQVR